MCIPKLLGATLICLGTCKINVGPHELRDVPEDPYSRVRATHVLCVSPFLGVRLLPVNRAYLHVFPMNTRKWDMQSH